MNYYPKVMYDGLMLTDISRRFIIQNIETEYSRNIYFEYLIKNWKSPESIAYDYYGSCNYIWAILVMNNIIDPVKDWLLKDEELKSVIIEKYGMNNIYSVHHYEKDGIMYRSYVNGCKEVSNYEYEHNLNEKKRKIKIIYPELITTIENEIKKEFKQ